MKKIFTLFTVLLAFVGCQKSGNSGIDEELVDVTFVASTLDDASRVSFEYTDGLYMKWETTDLLTIYIKDAGGNYERQNTLMSPVDGTMSEDGTEMKFYGRARALRTGESYVFAYPAIPVTERPIDIASQEIGSSSLDDLKKYTVLLWESDSLDVPQTLVRKSSVVKLSISGGLPANATIKSITLTTLDKEPVFINTIDFALASQNKYRTNSIICTFTNQSTNSSGGIDGPIFIATPLVDSSYITDSSAEGQQRGYTLHIVCEKDEVIADYKTTKTINAGSAFTQGKVYSLSRNEFETASNPGSDINPDDEEASKTVASVIGPWDEYGRPVDDIYGILSAGQNFVSNNRRAELTIDAVRNLYTNGSDDENVHGDDFRTYFWTLCGDTGTNQGPQYVGSLPSGTEDYNFNNIRIIKDTKVYISFIGTRAWNKNSLGYYVYPTSEEASYRAVPEHTPQQKVQEQIVFPSLSQPTGSSSAYRVIAPKTTVQMLNPQYDAQGKVIGYSAEFPTGTTIGFVVRVAKWAWAIKPSELDLQSRALYTNVAWNNNNKNITSEFKGWPITYNDGTANRNIYNAISARRVLLGTLGYDSYSLIYGAFDMAPDGSPAYNARFCNPVWMIYTDVEDAIDFFGASGYNTGNNYWMTETDKDFYTISSINDPNSPVFATASGSIGWTYRESNYMSATHEKHKWLITSGKDSKVNIDLSQENIPDEGKEYYMYNIGSNQWIAGMSQTQYENVITAVQSNEAVIPVRIFKVEKDTSYGHATLYKIKYSFKGLQSWIKDTHNGKPAFGIRPDYDESTCLWIMTRHHIN